MKRNMQIRTVTALMFSVILISACDKQEVGESNRSNELQFRAFIEEGGEIRPMSAPESRAIAGNLATGYCLSALLTTGDYPMAAPNRLMWNVGMNRDGSYQSPTEKKYFWAAGDATLRHSFVAYSANPVGTAAGVGVDPATLAVGSDGRLCVDYTNPHDPAEQMDLLYSENVRNVKVSSSAPIVDLVFKHRLARVMVKMMCAGGVPLTDCQAKMSYKANAVKNTAAITLADNQAIVFKNTFHWDGGIYNLGSSFSLPGSATTPATAVEVGDLILLPGQSLAAEWATLTFTYTPDGGVTPQTVKTSFPAISLTAGKQFEILVNVAVDATTLSISGVTLTDWNSKSGNIDQEGLVTTPIPPTANEYFTFMGLKWAKGNLIGENSANCRVGKPTDHGLYFKYGSLVGWTGGTTGDGTGVSTNGAAATIYTKPGSYSGATSWSGVSWHGASSAVPIPVTDDEATAIGDPCRFYLGDEWRTPSQEEFESLTYSSWAANSGANGAWGGLVTSGWSNANSVFFSAPGNRDSGDGAMRQADQVGGYLAATWHNSNNNKALYFTSLVAPYVDNYLRSRAYPVRCVSGTYIPPRQPINPPSASDYVKIGSLYWTKGNLVATSKTANNMNGCKVGAPTDGGLYFQFGGLIGWKGGATANGGTGVGSNPNTGSGTQWWNGATTFSWSTEAMVWPTKMVGTPSSWPQGTSGTAHQWHFSGDGVSSGTINVNDPTKGVGDPCTYYLGDKWRLPTAAEYKALFDNVANNTGFPTANWSWVTSPYKGAQRAGNTLYVPASGSRHSSSGAFRNVDGAGYFWSSSVSSATYGYFLYFNSGGIDPQNSIGRSGGFPVRCVSTNP